MNHEEIIKKLREPFKFCEIEWKIQVLTNDKTRGMAVPYQDARAVQRRLDDVVGPFNWKNVYSLWHDNSQICGISIFNAERNEWVTKFDGAENSDIEPIKGGLSDSFKRAACIWGIGRYLYEFSGIWVEVENKGKSSIIKQNQYGKLESEYNAAVAKIFGKGTADKDASADAPDGKTPNAPVPVPEEKPKQPDAIVYGYKIKSIKPSGKSSQFVELVNDNGEVVSAYIKASDQSLAVGTHLREVKLERKNSEYGSYHLVTEYRAA